jgi:hypothetical protein
LSSRKAMSLNVEIDEAIHAHKAWKVNFHNFLNGKLALDVVHLGENNHCKFAQWLESGGRVFLTEKDYNEIGVLHADFHHVVAEIIHKIKEKDFTGAHADIEPEGVLDQASALLTQRLLKASLHSGAKAKSAADARIPEAETNKNPGDAEARP